MLRRQLGLARGAGLVVEEVVAGSVAEKSGLRQHDVLVLLDDQMLLLPEQLAALLDASTAGSAPECTLLRGGAKLTIPLGDRGHGGQASAGRVAPAVAGGPAAVPAADPPKPSAAATRQTVAKPSTAPGLRAPASALALAQGGQAATRSDRPSVKLTGGSAAEPARSRAAEEVLLREDDDYRIRLSRGRETRLLVLDTDGRILFNDEIDTPDHRGQVPAAVRQRVDEMERSLETAAPAIEIGRLEVGTVEIR